MYRGVFKNALTFFVREQAYIGYERAPCAVRRIGNCVHNFSISSCQTPFWSESSK